MKGSTPRIARVDIHPDGRVQVVCMTSLGPGEAGSLRAKLRHTRGAATATVEPGSGATRITVRPAPGIRGSELLGTLVAELQPTLKTNVVLYTAVFAAPSKVNGWINAIGFAFLAPIAPEERDRLAHRFLDDFVQHMGGPGIIAYQEGQLFVLSVEGDVPRSLRRQGLSLNTIVTESADVNIALWVDTITLTARPPTTIEGLVKYMRGHIGTL